MHLSVILFTGGMPGPRGGGAWSWGVPGPGGCLVPGGVWSRGMPGLRGVSGPRGCLVLGMWGCLVLGGGLVQTHNQGESQGGSGPGPQPRGKLRGIWSRPTTKGKVEGDLVQAHTEGGS